MGRGNDGLLNAVSIFFLAATGVAIIVFIVMGFTGGVSEEQLAVLPTLRVLPSPTDTPIPPTPTDTTTPLPTETPTETATPTATASVPPTATTSATPLPSATITPTPTVTPTLDVTFTPTFEPTPTGPTPTSLPPYPFAGPAAVQFTRNFANTQGCAWQGIGGQVLALGGGSFTNPLQVKVYNDFVDLPPVFTGTNSAYGAAGFEVRVANSITRDIYFVELQSRTGIPISEPVQVTFPGDCEQNVAIVNFQQVRSLNP